MRTLEDIFWNHTAKRKILFEDGEWCIYRKVDGPVSIYKPTNLYVIHRCKKVRNALDHDHWECGSGQGHGCRKTAPDGIQALYILSGWYDR